MYPLRTMSYSTSKYLIYSCFESKRSESESTIAGSLLLDCADTIIEAAEKVAMYKARGEDYDREYDKYLNYYHKSTRYIYIDNKAEWWQKG